MHQRRQFIRVLTLGGLASIFHGWLGAEPADGKRRKLGLLLGTLEGLMFKDPEHTLGQIAALGYTELEYPRTYGLREEQLSNLINKYKLRSLGGGDNLQYLTRNFPQLVEEYNRLGKKYAFCYWPWLDAGVNKSIDDWKRNADAFNVLGKRFKESGLRLAYHNHDIEFRVTEEKIPYDILLEYTDPALLAFEMDIWWIEKGGRDPLEYVRKYPGRFEVCHIKPAGLLSGTEEVKGLHFKDVVTELAAKGGCIHFILENEPRIADPLSYVKKGYRYLKTL